MRFSAAALLLAAPAAPMRGQDPKFEVTRPDSPGTELESVAYLPMQLGDSWLYADDGGETVTVLVSGQRAARLGSRTGSALRLDDSFGGYLELVVVPGVGVAWTEEAALGGTRVRYDGTLRLLPARIETGARYATSAAAVLVLEEDEVPAGEVECTTEVRPLVRLETPAGSFEDALPLVIRLRVPSEIEGEEATETTLEVWLARGIGPVRWRGARPMHPAFGKKTTVDLELVEAAIGGSLVPAPPDERPEIAGSSALGEDPPQ